MRVAYVTLTELQRSRVVARKENEDLDPKFAHGSVFHRSADDAHIYYIDIKNCINYFNLRVHLLREKLIEEMESPVESYFWCATCKKRHDLVEVARIAAETGQEVCGTCQGPLKYRDTAKRKVEAKKMLEHYDVALRPLLHSLEQTRDLVLNTENDGDALHLYRMDEAIRMSEGRSRLRTSQSGLARFGDDSGGGVDQGAVGVLMGEDLTMDMHNRKRATQEAIPWLERGSQAFHHEQALGSLARDPSSGMEGASSPRPESLDLHSGGEEEETPTTPGRDEDGAPLRKRPKIVTCDPKFQEYLAKVRLVSSRTGPSAAPSAPPILAAAAPPPSFSSIDGGTQKEEEEDEDDFEEVEV